MAAASFKPQAVLFIKPSHMSVKLSLIELEAQVFDVAVEHPSEAMCSLGAH